MADAGVGEVGEAAGAVLGGSHHDVGVDDAVEGLVVAAGEVGGGDADVGDVIAAFLGVIIIPAAYNARSDPDGDNDIGDVIQLYLGNIPTKCAVFTFENDTGGEVDDMHI